MVCLSLCNVMKSTTHCCLSIFFCKQKTAYEMRISDWSSYVCSSDLVAVPAGLGLIGFVEPCSLGSSLVFVKYLEGKGATAKLLEVTLFAVTRAAFIGL